MEDLQKYLSASSFTSLSSSSSSSNLHPLSIGVEHWLIAEKRTQEILCLIQPTIVSEQQRKEVIEYIQSLIRGYYGTEVFPFGSVPLKTYLLDGDIDLTALCHQNLEEDLARDICSLLEAEEQQDAEFQVKEVQYIRAQVKIVKCIIQNIAVDISFNQMAGLCALCFLEQVDQLFGKDHLLKRSLILIKAWCYYESRILGAHHGLISSYALEILVFYIINLFHSSLHGPLAVLYKFLAYYSTFNWDTYCVSVNGPVAISSLPEISAETPEIDGGELFLNKDFLRNCTEMFEGPIRALETSGLEFPVKHLNIVDPLKDNNNLGRSVNKGNFHRIRCAFSYGARKLGEILVLPEESMDEELKKFFKNTLNRNRMGQRSDVQVPIPVFGAIRSEVSDLRGDYDCYYSGLQCGQWYHGYTLPSPIQPSPPSSPSQIQNRNAWNATGRFVRFDRNYFSRRNTNVFVPRQPFCHPNSPQLSVTAFGVEEMLMSRGTGPYIPDMGVVEKAKSRGTGTYIPRKGFRKRMKSPRTGTSFPDTTYCCHRDLHLSERGMNTESSNHGLLQKPPQDSDSDWIEVPSETDHGVNISCLDLSLEEFPLLQGSKMPVPSEIDESGQANLKSPEAKDSSPSLESIEFGTFEHSPPPLELPSLEASVHSDSETSTAMDAVQDVQTIAMQKPQELSKNDDEMVLVQPYQLEDDKDFPPLSL